MEEYKMSELKNENKLDLKSLIEKRNNVLDEGKMWSEVFIYEGQAIIQVRVSDHSSNLEKICGGVSGNKMSMAAFKELIKNNVIENS